MALQLRTQGYVAVGVFGSIALFLLGLVLLTISRGNPLVFWMVEIVVLVVLGRAILVGLGHDVGAWMKSRGGSAVLSTATMLSLLAFLALWVYAVVLSGGRVGLPTITGYATASGALLFLVSLPSRRADLAHKPWMPLLVAGVLVMSSVGFLYLAGGTP